MAGKDRSKDAARHQAQEQAHADQRLTWLRRIYEQQTVDENLRFQTLLLEVERLNFQLENQLQGLIAPISLGVNHLEIARITSSKAQRPESPAAREFEDTWKEGASGTLADPFEVSFMRKAMTCWMRGREYSILVDPELRWLDECEEGRHPPGSTTAAAAAAQWLTANYTVDAPRVDHRKELRDVRRVIYQKVLDRVHRYGSVYIHLCPEHVSPDARAILADASDSLAMLDRVRYPYSFTVDVDNDQVATAMVLHAHREHQPASLELLASPWGQRGLIISPDGV